METILIFLVIILGCLFCGFLYYINKQNNKQHLFINKYNKKSYILLDYSYIYLNNDQKEINIVILKDIITNKIFTVTIDEFNKYFINKKSR